MGIEEQHIYDFEDIMQKNYVDMTEGEWRMAVASMFFRVQKQEADNCDGVTKRLDKINGTVAKVTPIENKVNNHDKQLVGMWIGISTVGVPILIGVLKYVFNL
jgi:hypothetical protein